MTKKIELTFEQCEQWRNNPTKNPITNRSIEINKGTYNMLVEECAKVYAKRIEKK